MSFQQDHDEQEHRQQCIAALQRVETWQHTREDVLLLASELGLLTIFQGATDEQKQPHG